MRPLFLALVVAALIPCVRADAADPVPIGFVTTLSGPGGYLGEDARDAFNLAVAEDSGKLGGVPVKVMVEDDALKPATALQITRRFLNQDHAKIITGVIFSNVAGAIVPDVLDTPGAFYLSPNAGPSNYAGKDCTPNYFVVSWANESMNGSAGTLASELKYKRVATVAPNYQAGKDAVTGFKRQFNGSVISERYTSLDQTDFAAEISQIRNDAPDAVFEFQPGSLGITFLKQYVQAGLAATIPLVVAMPALDARILTAAGDAALGVHISTFWNADFPNPASQAFVAHFEAAYHRTPTIYAAQGYDTARLIGSALAAVGGDMTKTDAFRAALRKADFVSVRGAFKFAPDQHPIQDWYGAEVVKQPDGTLQIKTTGVIRKDEMPPNVADCHMAN